jgi:Domain of unknown function (DUF4861)
MTIIVVIIALSIKQSVINNFTVLVKILEKKMNNIKIVILMIFLSTPVYGGEIKISVENASATDRLNEVIALNWAEIVKLDSNISVDNARVVCSCEKIKLSQTVDNDGDGVVDELLFVADIPGKGKKNFKVVSDKSLKIPETNAVVYARHVPERKDDFAWENDVIGFRAYGPGLVKGKENCGFDCFMKRVDYPIIDEWYKKISYHLDTGTGHDAYHVGDGLGCGGSAIWQDGKMHTSNVYMSYKQYANGPVRAVFDLSYGPWEVDGKQITETKHITVDLGKRMFKVDDQFFVDGKPEKLDIVIGVATHDGKADAYKNQEKGYLYCWEKIDKHHLGTGIFLAPDYIKEYKLIESKKKDAGHALYVVSTDDEGKVTYYAGYGWEKAKQIVTREQWEDYIINFILENKNPVKVSFE